MTWSISAAAEQLDWNESRIRALIRAGLVEPDLDDSGRMALQLGHLVLLRAAAELEAAGVPPRKLTQSLKAVKDLLPDGRPLSAVRLSTRNNQVVVADGGVVFDPQSRQVLLDFDQASTPPAPPDSADFWYEQGLGLEDSDRADAQAAYARALKRDPEHVESNINLGRMLQQSGQLEAAEHHYRRVLQSHPSEPIAAFNLGTLYEGQSNRAAAESCYLIAAQELPDAHYSLARLYEAQGERRLAIRHLNEFRLLSDDST